MDENKNKPQELTDSEIEAAAGGGEHDDETGGLITTVFYSCEHYRYDSESIMPPGKDGDKSCGSCLYAKSRFFHYLCTHPANGYRV